MEAKAALEQQYYEKSLKQDVKIPMWVFLVATLVVVVLI